LPLPILADGKKSASEGFDVGVPVVIVMLAFVSIRVITQRNRRFVLALLFLLWLIITLTCIQNCCFSYVLDDYQMIESEQVRIHWPMSNFYGSSDFYTFIAWAVVMPLAYAFLLLKKKFVIPKISTVFVVFSLLAGGICVAYDPPLSTVTHTHSLSSAGQGLRDRGDIPQPPRHPSWKKERE